MGFFVVVVGGGVGGLVVVVGRGVVLRVVRGVVLTDGTLGFTSGRDVEPAFDKAKA